MVDNNFENLQKSIDNIRKDGAVLHKVVNNSTGTVDIGTDKVKVIRQVITDAEAKVQKEVEAAIKKIQDLGNRENLLLRDLSNASNDIMGNIGFDGFQKDKSEIKALAGNIDDISKNSIYTFENKYYDKTYVVKFQLPNGEDVSFDFVELKNKKAGDTLKVTFNDSRIYNHIMKEKGKTAWYSTRTVNNKEVQYAVSLDDIARIITINGNKVEYRTVSRTEEFPSGLKMKGKGTVTTFVIDDKTLHQTVDIDNKKATRVKTGTAWGTWRRIDSLTNPVSKTGDLFYYDGKDIKAIPVGLAGQFLTIEGRENEEKYIWKTYSQLSTVVPEMDASGMGGYLSAGFATDKGAVILWGKSDHGNLPDGSQGNTVRYEPEAFTITGDAFGRPIKWIRKNCSNAILYESGNLFVFGKNIDNMFGNHGVLDDEKRRVIYKAEQFELSKTKKIKDFWFCFDGSIKIGAGYSGYAFYLTRDDELYACGYNVNGQLGLSTTNTYNTTIKTPLKVDTSFLGTAKIKGLYTTGTSHVVVWGCAASFILDTNGKLWACGDSRKLHLGFGPTDKDTETFKEIHFPDNVKIIDFCVTQPHGIDTLRRHCIALGEDNNVYVWGDNTWGQLGLGHKKAVKTPVRCSFFDDKKATHVIAYGTNYCGCAVATEEVVNGKAVSRIYTCGSGFKHRLGKHSAAQPDRDDTTSFIQTVYMGSKLVKSLKQMGGCDSKTIIVEFTDKTISAFGHSTYNNYGTKEQNEGSGQPFELDPTLPNEISQIGVCGVGAETSLCLIRNDKYYQTGRGGLQTPSIVTKDKTPDHKQFYNISYREQF